MWNASRFCVSSLRRGHANLLCIVPILVYVLPKQAHNYEIFHCTWSHKSLKGAQVWDFDVLDFNDFFIMKSI
jgi:hypothetical protein